METCTQFSGGVLLLIVIKQVKLRLDTCALTSRQHAQISPSLDSLWGDVVLSCESKTDSQLSLQDIMLAVHVSENHRYIQGCNFLPNMAYHVHVMFTLFDTFHIRRQTGWWRYYRQQYCQMVKWKTTWSFFPGDKNQLIFRGSRIVFIHNRGDQNRYFVPERSQSINTPLWQEGNRKFNQNKLKVETFIRVTGLEIQHL